LAEDAAAEADEGVLADHANTGVVLGAKLGGGLGQVTSEFGASYVLELELGYMLPLPKPVGRSFELFVTGQYMRPSTTGTTTADDPRLPGDGTLHYDVAEQELALTLGVLYRLPLPIDLLMPYAAAGARLYMLRSTVTGSGGGQALGTTEETSSEAGAYFALGADFFLGPGALLAELQFAYGGVDRFVLRDTNVGTLNLAVGYRLML
jgi:hypothetical protein